MKWMIQFGWVRDRVAEDHIKRLDAIGAKRGKMIDHSADMACPLVWTENLPRAVEIASKFPLAG